MQEVGWAQAVMWISLSGGSEDPHTREAQASGGRHPSIDRAGEVFARARALKRLQGMARGRSSAKTELLAPSSA